jgi:thiamine-monophosphate kinase
MKLQEIGEFGFIDRFTPWFKDLVHEHQVGIGDDCAIISANDTEDWLITTDLLMEDVHFLRDAITPWQLGYKSLAVNLSDIAAMGGTPTGSFLSIAIPESIDVEYLDAFMKGYHELSAKYQVPLLGGDTTRSLKHLAINVCVTGKCPKGKARKRNMAQSGDVLCVTGNLGDSAAGLKLLLEKRSFDLARWRPCNTGSMLKRLLKKQLSSAEPNSRIAQIGRGILLKKQPFSAKHDFLLEKHHKPEPRIEEGLFLSSFPEVHAMMDLSDGIASDLKHILDASGKKAVVNVDQLPLSDALIQVADEQHWDAVELAATGGEDYELLLTVAAEDFPAIEQNFLNRFGKPLCPIGFIEEGAPRIQWLKEGVEYPFSKSGFNHFIR